jgi:hypothetical protein
MTTYTPIDRIFNFYGTDRHAIPGVHPSERMDESVAFPTLEEQVYDDESELLEVRPVEGEQAKLNAAITAHAMHLLAIWKDQPAVYAIESGDRERYQTWHREEAA